ncbi:hypothetical protein [Nocardioides sp. AE5]|uniref:hypothetical protein n=1 Tax=Nocardioides sp. AE5 TaxID=2962573 RepID=UPI002882836E|nr:hypothetical protein [Nocardioides sp. AE5]MDT0203087.1 hypothetical protein [Nocardioides sp. AE5]
MSINASSFTTLSKVEQGALIAGGLSLILSFIGSYIRVSIDGVEMFGNFSSGTNAWTSYATLGMLLILAATALVVVRLFAAAILPSGVPWYLITLAASALGTFLIILRALTASDSAFGASVGPGWSGWALFITTIALTACTALMFKASGEKLPDLPKPDASPNA